jgi:hypothetical protein
MEPAEPNRAEHENHGLVIDLNLVPATEQIPEPNEVNVTTEAEAAPDTSIIDASTCNPVEASLPPRFVLNARRRISKRPSVDTSFPASEKRHGTSARVDPQAASLAKPAAASPIRDTISSIAPKVLAATEMGFVESAHAASPNEAKLAAPGLQAFLPDVGRICKPARPTRSSAQFTVSAHAQLRCGSSFFSGVVVKPAEHVGSAQNSQEEAREAQEASLARETREDRACAVAGPSPSLSTSTGEATYAQDERTPVRPSPSVSTGEAVACHRFPLRARAPTTSSAQETRECSAPDSDTDSDDSRQAKPRGTRVRKPPPLRKVLVRSNLSASASLPSSTGEMFYRDRLRVRGVTGVRLGDAKPLELESAVVAQDLHRTASASQTSNRRAYGTDRQHSSDSLAPRKRQKTSAADSTSSPSAARALAPDAPKQPAALPRGSAGTQGTQARGTELGLIRKPKRAGKVNTRCEHDKVKSLCRDCGGGSLCKHDRPRSKCIECGTGKAFCKHGRPKARCKECHGSDYCIHGKRKFVCSECCGSQLCTHGISKSSCRFCGKGYCHHGRERSVCKPCGGSQICLHGRRRCVCKECGGSQICPHGRRKAECRECKLAKQALAIKPLTSA